MFQEKELITILIRVKDAVNRIFSIRNSFQEILRKIFGKDNVALS